jgi:uncharacterized membrane protein YdfJ with MMPL/SSD domain
MATTRAAGRSGAAGGTDRGRDPPRPLRVRVWPRIVVRMGHWTSRLALRCAVHPWRVVAAWVALLVAAVVCIGALLSSALTTDSTVTANLESKTGFDLIDKRLPNQDPLGGEIVIVRSDTATVTDPAFRAAVQRLARDIEATGKTPPVQTYYDTGAAALVSADRHATLLPVTLLDKKHVDAAATKVIDVVQAADGNGFTVNIAGQATLGHDFLRISEQDLRKGELYFGLPAALIVLLLVFGAVVAASVPLILAMVAIPVTIGVVALIGQVYQLSFFVVNMVVAMGLALGIDYSLFVVSRYREERRAGAAKTDAITRAGATATVAVTFSGMSFTVALLGLLLVPDETLRSLAVGAVIVGMVTVLLALTLLPAVLSLLGDRIDALPVPFVHSAVHSGQSREGRHWRRFVHVIMRRPAVTLALAVGFLLLCALPVLGLRTGQSGVSALPDGLISKQGFLALQSGFPGAARTDPARVVVEGNPADPAVRAAVGQLQAKVAADRTFGPTAVARYPAAGLTVVDVPLPGDPNNDPAKAALRTLRHDYVVPAFAGAPAKAYVTGTTAFNLDYAALISTWLPRVIGFVLVLTFVLLTLIFRSVVLAGKAVVLNLLSVGAAYGLLVLVFQDGVGNGLLGLTRAETVEPWVPVFLFSVLFALSMDYHVFLLSRIREHYTRTGNTREAVAEGIATTGRLITGAALIIVVVFAGFAAGDLVGFQQMGFGVAVALLLDATVVRSIVVPASMALLDRWNWYLPRWLSWLPELQVEGQGTGRTPAAGEPAVPAGVVPGQRAERAPSEERGERR